MRVRTNDEARAIAAIAEAEELGLNVRSSEEASAFRDPKFCGMKLENGQGLDKWAPGVRKAISTSLEEER